MKKREVDHVLRAAGRITGEKQCIIIGSQSLHGKYPDLADSLVPARDQRRCATSSNPAFLSVGGSSDSRIGERKRAAVFL